MGNSRGYAIVGVLQVRGDDQLWMNMADTGVSMGKSGTEVMSWMSTLAPSRWPSTRGGKVDVPNILSFQLSTSAVALTLITLSAVFGLGNMNPLNAMQILFTNILVDGGHSLPSV